MLARSLDLSPVLDNEMSFFFHFDEYLIRHLISQCKFAKQPQNKCSQLKNSRQETSFKRFYTLYAYANAASVFRESILRILCLDVGVRARILEHAFVCSWTRDATPEMTMVLGRFTGTRQGYAPTCDITGAVSLDHKHTPSLSRREIITLWNEPKRTACPLCWYVKVSSCVIVTFGGKSLSLAIKRTL